MMLVVVVLPSVPVTPITSIWREWLARERGGERAQLAARVRDPRIRPVGGEIRRRRRLTDHQHRAPRQRSRRCRRAVGLLPANGDEARAWRHRVRFVGHARHVASASPVVLFRW